MAQSYTWWQNLQIIPVVILYLYVLSYQDDIVSIEPDKFQDYVRVYAPIYMQLVEVMLTKVQYPSDEEYSTWNSGGWAQCRELFRGSTMFRSVVYHELTMLRQVYFARAALAVRAK